MQLQKSYRIVASSNTVHNGVGVLADWWFASLLINAVRRAFGTGSHATIHNHLISWVFEAQDQFEDVVWNEASHPQQNNKRASIKQVSFRRGFIWLAFGGGKNCKYLWYQTRTVGG